MFEGATTFNRNLAAWDVSNGLSFSFMFMGTTCKFYSYDKTQDDYKIIY